jgi:rhodanese-related sulfurtransferase
MKGAFLMQTIDTDQLKAMIDANEDLLVINVLSEDDFREHHIPQSVNIPVEEGDFVDEVERHVDSKDQEIVVYCANTQCDASPKAARKLEDAGFTNVYDYEGGIEEWEQANQPVATGSV